MLLGLLADIHESVASIVEALRLFREAGVEEILVLGDVCRMHRHLEETVAILRKAGAVGVWGNHDYGLCQDVSEVLQCRYSPALLDWMGSLQPALMRDDCLFTHVEPWLDPRDITQLWYFDSPPDTPEKLARNFAAVPQRVLFSGHVHAWYLATPEGRLDWNGEPVHLAPPTRYLVILNAVVGGHCALYDTVSGQLTPLRVPALEE